jgi:hypothetical protein
MRPLRALLPTLRRQPLAALAREAIWRLWKPYRSASYLAAIRRGEPSLRFRPVPYYQPNLSDVGDGANAIVGFADQVCTGRFPFLGYETAELGFPPRWNVDFVTSFEWEHLPAAQVQPVVRHNGSDVKAPWELSRLQFLPVLAKAYLLTREFQYREAAKELFSDWQAKNPVGIGVNWTLAMETALRGMSLCFLLSLMQPLRPDEENWGKEVTRSIWQHLLFTESCLEFSHLLRSNHYLGNIVGLHCMATFLDGPGIERRRRSYQQRVQHEIFRQVYEDGGDYEASFSYHFLVLQMFTSSFLLMRADQCAPMPEFTARVRGMFSYLAELADDNGCVPQVGDSDDGRVELLTSDLSQMITLHREDRNSLRVPGYLALGDALFNLGCGGDPSDSAWYGLRPYGKKAVRPRLTVFSRSGVAIGRNNDSEVVLCAIPNGIHGSGSHTHNDKLSMIVRIGGAELLCDSGTFWYTRDTRLRNLYRSTAAHNTIAIDGEEQNQINQAKEFAFCIGDQAAISTIDATLLPGEVRMSASHSGYWRLGVEHRRSLRMETDCISIEDVLSGNGDHSFEMFWHLPSSWRIEDLDCGEFSISGPIRVKLDVRGELPLVCSYESASISRTYGGATEAGTVLRVKGQGRFPCTLATKITWEAGCAGKS